MKNKTRLLEEIEKGKTLNELVETLDMRRQTIKAMIELLLHQGKLKEVDCNSTCDGCPMSKSCPVPAGGREKLYVLAEEEAPSD